MNERRAFRLFLALFIGLSFDSTLFRNALAQAWVPPKGEGAVGIAYGYTFVRDHLLAEGEAIDTGHMRTSAGTLSLGYGLTERLALSVDLPYVVSKYYGANPHRPVQGGAPAPEGWRFIDDGHYHDAFADFRVDLRYQVLKAPVVLTPFAAFVIPSHDYVYFAHSAVGRDVHEYQIGTYIARILDPIFPDAYVQGRYGYTFAEEILGIRHDRSNVDLALGYFVTPSLDIRAIGSLGYTYGGIELFANGPPGSPGYVLRHSIYWPHHDQIGRERYVNVAGGIGYALTGSLDVYASYVATVWGESGHKIRYGFNLGFSYGFSPLQIIRGMLPQKTQEPNP